jgi:hypothetical protein
MILSPMLDQPYDDRESDCQLAIELQVHQLVDLAVAAGWKRTEAMAAIANVALDQMFAEQENQQSSFRVAQALGKVEH